MPNVTIYITKQDAEWLKAHPEFDAVKGDALRRWIKLRRDHEIRRVAASK